MKIRVKFRKWGCMKFIGHLDMMRYFQKAVRRADIDIRYSGTADKQEWASHPGRRTGRTASVLRTCRSVLGEAVSALQESG